MEPLKKIKVINFDSFRVNLIQLKMMDYHLTGYSNFSAEYRAIASNIFNVFGMEPTVFEIHEEVNNFYNVY